MLFSELIRNIPILAGSGSLETELSGIACDSRRVKSGFLFVCLQGETDDGHRFIDEALKRGAAGLVTGKAVSLREIPWVQVHDPRESLAPLAANFFGHPSGRLRLVGITGTNGKTTTSYLVRSVYEAAGYAAAVMGTTGVNFKNYYREMDMTTPEAPLVQEVLASLANRGAAAVAMEVSSHSLAQQRVAACLFHGAIFTNLTRDHLDFHGSMEEYFLAKARLFEGQAGFKPRFAILNADDPTYPHLKARVSMPVVSYGLGCGAEVTVQGSLQQRPFGQSFSIKTPGGSAPVHLNLPETFNIYNALAAAALGAAEGFPLETIKEGLEKVRKVPGRLELLPSPEGYKVILDYAHTPDALEKVLAFLKKQEHRRLLAVFGCPGERDKGKRPIMGRIASDYCDLVVLTADNPAREDAVAIIEDIRAGVRGEWCAVPDREEAVWYALSRAKAGDILLVAGKGHETYQLVGREKIPYSDRLVVRRFFASKGLSSRVAANPTYPQPDFAELQKPRPSRGGGVCGKPVPGQYGPHGPSPDSLP